PPRLTQRPGTDKFAKREEATRALEEIGEPAYDALQVALGSDDVEVRKRAEGILLIIAARWELRRFDGHTDQVYILALSTDSLRILSGGADQTVRLWEAAKSGEVRRFAGHTGPVDCVALSPDSKWALSGGEDSTLRLWNLETGSELRRYEGHTAAVWNA